MAIKPEFIVERQGKSVVLYAGLLSEAHEQGLQAIQTHLLQIPDDANGRTAIVQATVVTSKGTYQGLGDANPGNVAKFVVAHIIRMAETRAKARALRDAVNVGMLALDELDGDDDHDPAPPPAPVDRPKMQAAAAGALQRRAAEREPQGMDGLPSTPAAMLPMIAKQRDQLGWSNEEMTAFTRQRYSGRGPTKLTNLEAEELLKALSEMTAEREYAEM